jgi:hypothetical protein
VRRKRLRQVAVKKHARAKDSANLRETAIRQAPVLLQRNGLAQQSLQPRARRDPRHQKSRARVSRQGGVPVGIRVTGTSALDGCGADDIATHFQEAFR